MTTTAAAPSRRARTHAATVAEIKATARGLMAEQGTASLNLRGVARELGMTPSALYRYFDSRDALLTALIVESYDAVGSVAEAAAAGVPAATPPVEAFMTVAGAVRAWAVERPHEFALLFGTPVPGYEPPPDTQGHALRVSMVLLGMLRECVADGRVVLDVTDAELDPSLRAAMQSVCAGDFAGLTPGAVALALGCWSALLGALSTEVFGHLPDDLGDASAELFAYTMRRHLRSMGFAQG